MKKPELKPGKRRELERKQLAAIARVIRTSEALGEHPRIRIRGRIVRSYVGKRGKSGVK